MQCIRIKIAAVYIDLTTHSSTFFSISIVIVSFYCFYWRFSTRNSHLFLTKCSQTHNTLISKRTFKTENKNFCSSNIDLINVAWIFSFSLSLFFAHLFVSFSWIFFFRCLCFFFSFFVICVHNLILFICKSEKSNKRGENIREYTMSMCIQLQTAMTIAVVYITQ